MRKEWGDKTFKHTWINIQEEIFIKNDVFYDRSGYPHSFTGSNHDFLDHNTLITRIPVHDLLVDAYSAMVLLSTTTFISAVEACKNPKREYP